MWLEAEESWDFCELGGVEVVDLYLHRSAYLLMAVLCYEFGD